jgi:hypothetical protein
MAQPVRIVGHKSDRDENEQIQAQVDDLGNLMVREGAYPGLCKTYEETAFNVGKSPATHDFGGDTGRYATSGYIICDGEGDIQVDFTRDGIDYSDKFTMKKNERNNLAHLDIWKVRITHTGVDSKYRINLI